MMKFTFRRSAKVIGATLACIAVSQLMLMPQADATVVNLVQNGTFALGSSFAFTDWSVSSSGGSPAQRVALGVGNFDTLTTGSPEQNPADVIYFTTDTGVQILSQQIALGIGTYSIGFDLAASGLGNPYDATFSASIAGTSLLASASVATIGAANGAGTWVTEIGVANIATAGNYTVAFTFAGGGTPAKDVSITRVFVVAGDVSNVANVGVDVPEPMTVALLATAMFGLGLARRR